MKTIGLGFSAIKTAVSWVVYYDPGSTVLPVIGEKPNQLIASAILRALVECGEEVLNLAIEEIVDRWEEKDEESGN